MLCYFTIPQKLPSLNDYINKCRTNKYIGGRFKHEQDVIVENAIYEAIKNNTLRKLKEADFPVVLKITYFEDNRKRDVDNILSAKKYILDALQKKEIFPNDSQKYVVGFSESIFIDKNNPHILVEIYKKDEIDFNYSGLI